MEIKVTSRTWSRNSPQSVTQWSWLHATAYSSAIVASMAYMHTQLNLYFKSLDANHGHDDRLYNLAIIASISSEHLDGLHHLLSDLTFKLRWLMVISSLAVWLGTLVLSRHYHLLSPLRRITTSLGAYILFDNLRDWQLQRTKTKRTRRHGMCQYYSCRSMTQFGSCKDGDLEIDEKDLLIVSSLSFEPPLLTSTMKPYFANDISSGDKGEYSSRMTEKKVEGKEFCRNSNGDVDGKIVLHPREGAQGGRHVSNQIISNDPYVSRFHFQIQYDPMEKEYYLQDLGSTTGTFIFLKPDTPKRLHVDDHIKIGDTEFKILAIDENVTTGMPYLRICFTDGPLTGIRQTVGKTSVTLGRHSSNALCITEDDSISSRHSVISYFGNGFYITDLHSTNGTAIRLSSCGNRSRRRYLMHGDVFGVGSNRFMVEYSLQLESHQACSTE
ncbi:SMAD/FHA domain [Plasmopara halstedii]|uniref:SMAD/FHA domain n=1 Tax=Plasmopara halstedii TaxID=4781 RepID=A0A0N7L856_PLAHL|nr:SMAD/FHA domain [Plasmopara halstedii]CEG48939.1 SMAD/FHA domain [Plasmopara halstedii]|eukprot:XP_024585308.1 SMAD/FHA domain [Plasmopara halstedii]